MRRLKLLRLLIVIITFTCVTLLAISVWTEMSSAVNSGPSLHSQMTLQREMSRTDNGKINDHKQSRVYHTLLPLPSQTYNNSITKSQRKTNFNIFDGQRPWFLKNGKLTSLINDPTLALWPEESHGDRIVNQLMYIPEGYERLNSYAKDKSKLKKILIYFGRGGWSDLPLGQTKFLDDNCPVNSCTITVNQDEAPKADAILFKDRFVWPKHRRIMSQVWILFLLECPLHTQMFRNLGPYVFNWTATYRHDSDLVAPYEKFVTVNRYESMHKQKINYARGKSKKVAWFVSNCGARNKRLEYARELSKYIDVDIFGSCGNHKCPRSKANHCFDLLNRDYKFYLAFENSNCRDYITEKFWVNGLGHNSPNFNLIPIVMGAHPDDYRRVSPFNSYIHIDDFASPKVLAEYLHKLDKNDDLFNEYFQWKGTGEFINTYFWCRMCALLHAPSKPSKGYSDINQWWASPGVCLPGPGHWSRDNNGNNEGDENFKWNYQIIN